MEGLKLVDAPPPLSLLSTASRPRHRSRRPHAVRSYIEHVGFSGRSFIRVPSSCMHFSKSPRKNVFTIRNTSASVQPVTPEMMEDISKDHSVSGDAIRSRFLNFYAARGHKILSSSSLVPDDPTVLLTIAGMLQFKPIFLGKEPRHVPCAATSQRCLRTNDIENVGRTSRHHTFFEMLGNFSFGDYFKKEAIIWAWELTTKEFGIPPERLWISVFEDDDEAFFIWHNEQLLDCLKKTCLATKNVLGTLDSMFAKSVNPAFKL